MPDSLFFHNMEFRRFRRAEDLASAGAAASKVILEALAGIAPVLEEQALDEGQLRLEASPRLILAVPARDPDRTDEGAGSCLVAVLTRTGSLERFTLDFDSRGLRSSGTAALPSRRLAAFTPDQDQILGLYCTRSTTPFSTERELILVLRREDGGRVYSLAIDQDAAELRPLGDRLPPWLAVCPIGVPVASDIFQNPPPQPPPAGATSAVWLSGRLHAASPLERPDCLRGEFLHCLGEHLAVSRKGQTLEILDSDASEILATRRLPDKPVCLCPVPAGPDGRARLLVGHETGVLSVMVVLPAGSLSGVWNKLVTLLRQNEGLDTFPRLARWAQAQLLAFQSQKGPAERQRSAVLLRILAECLPADPAARQNQFTEELARLFQQPLSPEEFLPVLQPLRKIIRGWQEGEPGSYAQALDRIYSQLPYTLQELVDVELARHALVASRSERLDAPTSPISTQDATAYLELLGDWRTSREDLKAKPGTEPIALLSIHTEEWLQAFVLHRAVPCPERGPARARVARSGEALLLQGGRLLAFRPDNPAGLEDLTPPGWFEPRAFATVDPSGQSGSPVLILGEEDRLGWADLPAEGGAPSQVVAWNLEAEGRLRHAVPAGQGRLLVVSEPEGSESAWPQLLLLSFRERRVLARGSLPYRCPKELCLLAADSETWLLVADTRDEEVGLVQVRLTASSSLQVTVTASRAVRGRIRSIACARSKAEPARVFVGTANGYIFGLQLEPQEPRFDLVWLHRLLGAVRHLDAAPDEKSLGELRPRAGAARNSQSPSGAEQPALLAVGGGGEAVVLDHSGRVVWLAWVPETLHSACFLRDMDLSHFCFSDVAGTARLFRRTDRPSSYAQCQELLPRVPEDQWQKARTARFELAEGFRRLEEDPPDSWARISELGTLSARLCLLRRAGDALVERQGGPPLQQTLRRLVGDCRLDELVELARFAASAPRPARQDLLELILHELAFRLQNETVPLEPARQRATEQLVAELARGLGKGILQPKSLTELLGRPWRKLPQPVREDLWVQASLLLTVREGRASTPGLLEWAGEASFLGPRAFRILPLLVASEDRKAAVALAEAVERVGRPDSAPVGLANELRRLCAGSDRPVAALVSLLGLAAFGAPPSWHALVEAIGRCRRLEPSPALHPGLTAVLDWARGFERLATPEFSNAPVAEQLADLDSLPQQPTLPEPSKALEWASWVRDLIARLANLLEHEVELYRRELLGRQWVRLENLRFERFGSRFGTLKALRIRDGAIRRAEAKVTLRLVPGPGFRGLDGDLEEVWSWDRAPEELSWVGVLGPPGEWVEIECTTAVPEAAAADPGTYQHRHLWRVGVPAPESQAASNLLERVPALRDGILDRLRHLREGFHLLALDSSLGAESLALALLEQGTVLVQLDSELENLGPGRRDPSGLTADSLLRALRAEPTGSGGWRLRPGAGQRRVLAHPAEETAERLLRPGLAPVLESLRRLLRGLEGRPILWLLSTELAGRFQARLGPACTFHALGSVAPKLDAPLEEGRALELDLQLQDWVRSAGTPRSAAEQALAVFNGNLRLLLKWLEVAAESRPAPPEFLAFSPAAEAAILEEFAGLSQRDLADLLVALDSRLTLPVRQLRPGLLADESTRSRTRAGPPKPLTVVGEELTSGAISNLRSDPGRHLELRLRGYPVEGRGASLPAALQPLYLATRRPTNLVRRTYRQLAERGLVALVQGIAHVRQPYRTWLEGQLAKDPSGRSFLEAHAGDPLLDTLSLPEMAAAGEGLRALCPQLSEQGGQLARELGHAFDGEPRSAQLEQLLGRLCGRVVEARSLSQFDWASKLSPEQVERLQQAFEFFAVEQGGGSSTHSLGWCKLSRPPLRAWLRERFAATKGQVLTLLGPGLPEESGDEGPGFCCLISPRLKEILIDETPSAAFWRSVRNHVGLHRFSPFETSNALPFNSPVFVGREEETAQVLRGIDHRTFLILGGRQIGKTSLLRHLWGRVSAEPGRTALIFDCAGVKSAEKFWSKLRDAIKEKGVPVRDGGAPIEAVERNLRALPRPLLFLNEIDGLSLAWPEDSGLLARLRALSEDGACQYVMTGYHGAHGGVLNPQHPFFHWVQGETGRKALFLGPLSEKAAWQLVGKLEEPPLELGWENEEARHQGCLTLLELTYGIPILLQTACQKLVEHLDSERHQVIRGRDVSTAAYYLGAGIAWEYLRSSRPSLDPGAPDRTPSRAEVAWVDLVLASVVGDKFFWAEPSPIQDVKLREKDSRDFSFKALDLQDALRRALKRIQLLPVDLEVLDEGFSQKAYGRLLDVLSLTVSVAPLGTDRYYFPGFLYPLELDRYLKRSRQSLEGYLVDTAVEVLDELRPRPLSA